ncbi:MULTISPECIES: hypothetical protein [Streptomyces]|uniref:hypothetical protein n=1 Tax=Streptomyces TaxID=1883 RepID=UPI0021A5EE0B|nr:hypothetical protein [Streptomyces atratus]MCT2546915.1 hypothetical protein [Streptomyces atratus]
MRLSPEFRESYSEQGTEDGALVDRIFRTCQVVHVWRCHTVHQGFFYRCPQSYFIHRGRKVKPEESGDGLEIRDDGEFAQDLYRHLTSPRGPAACRWGLGSAGRRFAHEQVSQRQWTTPGNRPTEALLDPKLLETLENPTGTYHAKTDLTTDILPEGWTRPRTRTGRRTVGTPNPPTGEASPG